MPRAGKAGAKAGRAVRAKESAPKASRGFFDAPDEEEEESGGGGFFDDVEYTNNSGFFTDEGRNGHSLSDFYGEDGRNGHAHGDAYGVGGEAHNGHAAPSNGAARNGHAAPSNGAARNGHAAPLNGHDAAAARNNATSHNQEDLNGSPATRRMRRRRNLHPSDSPLRFANRERAFGLLTERAATTLLHYCSETNQHLYSWLHEYMHNNPIPKSGKWEDVTGDTFLRGLLNGQFSVVPPNPNVEALFDGAMNGLGVDPRQVAQRIIDIRTQLAEEICEDLMAVRQENHELLAEVLNQSLHATFNAHPLDEGGQGGASR